MRFENYIFTQRTRLFLLALLFFLLPGFAEANYFTLPVDDGTITSLFDHDSPDYTDNSNFIKYTGEQWTDGSASLGSCTSGVNCYDGHNGVDFATTTGANALAAADGEVEDIYWNSCGGWTMQIWHDDIGLSTLYAHIGTTTIATTSDSVSRGDHVAEVDSTGSCATGPHLHFGVTDGQSPSSNRIDPYGWWDAGSSDPWTYDQGYLWTTDEPSFDLAKSVSGTISATTTWRGTYLVTGNITVASGVTLTLEPGTVVKFQSNFRRMEVNGTLDALGTASKPIYFTAYADDEAGGDTNNNGTSTSPAAGQWREVQINAGGTGNFSHIIARYGGANTCCSQSRANISNAGGVITIEDSLIEYGSLYGITGGGTTTVSTSEIQNQPTGFRTSGVFNLYESDVHDHTSYGFSDVTGAKITIASSTFSNNTSGSGSIIPNSTFAHWNNTATGTGAKGVIVSAGTMTTNQTWSKDDIPYVVGGTVTVNSGYTLTIGSGTVVKFNVPSKFSVSGELFANGTSTDRVYFTSLRDDSVGGDTNGDSSATTPAAGDWCGISSNSNASTTIIYGDLRYGGRTSNSNCAGNATHSNIINISGTINLLNTKISTSTTYGAYSFGTTTITNSEIFNNPTGIYITTSPSLFITGNSIHGNTTYGLNNVTGSLVTVENNFWGIAGGPDHATSSNPGADKALGTLDFDPWLDSWP